MSLLKPHEFYIKNLKEQIPEEYARIYLPKAQALNELRIITGLDFGENPDDWDKWINENLNEFYKQYSNFLRSNKGE